MLRAERPHPSSGTAVGRAFTAAGLLACPCLAFGPSRLPSRRTWGRPVARCEPAIIGLTAAGLHGTFTRFPFHRTAVATARTTMRGKITKFHGKRWRFALFFKHELPRMGCFAFFGGKKREAQKTYLRSSTKISGELLVEAILRCVGCLVGLEPTTFRTTI